MNGPGRKFNREWKKLAVMGWKRCIWTVQVDRKPEPDRPVGYRVHTTTRGEQCHHWVSPEEITLRGAPVCVSHLPRYNAALKAAIDRRLRLDPGSPQI